MELYCFFFQAEDGIRDTSVTGVQTCALPIFLTHHYETGRHPDTCLFPQFVCLLVVAVERLQSRLQTCWQRERIEDFCFAAQIGRASCRERGYSAVDGEVVREKNEYGLQCRTA